MEKIELSQGLDVVQLTHGHFYGNTSVGEQEYTLYGKSTNTGEYLGMSRIGGKIYHMAASQAHLRDSRIVCTVEIEFRRLSGRTNSLEWFWAVAPGRCRSETQV